MKMTYNLILAFLVSLSFLFAGCITGAQNPTMKELSVTDCAVQNDGNVGCIASFSEDLYTLDQMTADKVSTVRDQFTLDGTPIQANRLSEQGMNCKEEYGEETVVTRICRYSFELGPSTSSVQGNHNLEVCSDITYMQMQATVRLGFVSGVYSKKPCETVYFTYSQ